MCTAGSVYWRGELGCVLLGLCTGGVNLGYVLGGVVLSLSLLINPFQDCSLISIIMENFNSKQII